MSEGQLNQLLPTCTLALFSKSAETVAAFEALENDWRCANLTFEVHKGGKEEAQTYYAGHASPDILIIETRETDKRELLASLETLAANCADNTSAILIGPDNDVDLYRTLTRMGVLDYLVTPVTTERLLEVIGTAILDKFGIADNTMSVVLGSHGGVGTSSIASMLAHGLAQNAGKKTALCDLLPGRSPLPVFWGVECPGGLADLAKAFKANDIASLYRLAPRALDNLHLFTPATDTPFDFALGHDEQVELLQGLRQHFPYLVYDTAGFTPKILKALIPTAPHVLLITTPAVTSLRATKKMLSQIEPLRGGDASAIKIILNRSKELGHDELSRKDVEAALGHAPALEIAYDRHLAAKLETGVWRDFAPAQTITADLLGLLGLNAPAQKRAVPEKKAKANKLLSWLSSED